jgi:acyl CoA:acetate/3-ketoacid CoA transferase beta subunit
MSATRAEYCVIACAETWRGFGEILASPMGVIPSLGARLARLTFAPDLLLTDGEATLVRPDGTPEGWLPYRQHLALVAGGRRHVMMGASQIDAYGNQNFALIGDPAKPKAQLLGLRGAPGNTINDTTSYWIPNHSSKVFVEQVDVVCGVGYDRAGKLHPAERRFHHLEHVVTNLGVLDFESPDHRMRLRSLHPGVTVDEVVASTGFELVIPDNVPESRLPTDDELNLIRDVIDPNDLRTKEVPA